jgi:hypothetical protein
VAVAVADGIQTLQVVQAVLVEVLKQDLLIRQVDQELQAKEITVLQAKVLLVMQAVAAVVLAAQVVQVLVLQVLEVLVVQV